MIVVSNTSPLCYLIVIDIVHILPALYRSVLIPKQVFEELSHQAPDSSVGRWVQEPPAWLKIHDVQPLTPTARLHLGEAAAIALAKREKAGLLLIDDDYARRFATQQGLHVTGTLGVLRDAALERLLDLRVAISRLRETTFRASASLYDDVLVEFERRKTTGD